MRLSFRCFFLFGVCLLAYFPGSAQGKNFVDQPYIEVTGQADSLVTPDLIYLSIQLSEKDTRNKSLDELEDRMIETLTAVGINTEQQLSLHDVSSNFRYYILKKTDIIKAKKYELKTYDAISATKAVASLEAIGISNVSIEKMEYSQINSLENIMRAKAIQNARDKATILASSLQQHIGRAIHIVDLNPNNIIVTQDRLQEVIVMGYGVNAAKSKNAAAPVVDFSPIKVRQSVQATFILQ